MTFRFDSWLFFTKFNLSRNRLGRNDLRSTSLNDGYSYRLCLFYRFNYIFERRVRLLIAIIHEWIHTQICMHIHDRFLFSVRRTRCKQYSIKSGKHRILSYYSFRIVIWIVSVKPLNYYRVFFPKLVLYGKYHEPNCWVTWACKLAFAFRTVWTWAFFFLPIL